MPVHNVQGPPKVATTVHCISAESILWQLCVESFKLCYADCLTKLETKLSVNPRPRASTPSAYIDLSRFSLINRVQV